MNDSPDSATGTQLREALTDLAASMPTSVALLEHVHDEVGRRRRRRRVARSTGAAVVAVAAIGGLVVLRAPDQEVAVVPASPPTSAALPSCAAVLASASGTASPTKRPDSGVPVDAAAAAKAATAPGALDEAKAAALAADPAVGDSAATTSTGAGAAAKPAPSPPAPGDHTKGLGVITGTPTATELAIMVTDERQAPTGTTLTFARSPATVYRVGDTPCDPEPLAAGQTVAYVATYGTDGALALDVLLIQ